MTGRVIYLAAAVLTLLGVSFAQAQAPGMYPPGGYGGPSMGSQGWNPAPRPYNPGPANRSWGDVTGNQGFQYEETPLDEFFRDVARDSYFRLEYMSWSFKQPGDTILGAPVALVANPTRRFPVTVAAQVAGEAVVPTTTGIDIDGVNGIRGTLGVPLTSGVLEANIFTFATSEERKEYLNLGAPTFIDLTALPQFVATSTFVDGSGADQNLFLYDEYYNMKLSSNLWGTEINYLFDAALPEPFLRIQPLIGFRFVNFDETFVQTGSFNEQGNFSGVDANGNSVTRLVSTIASQAENRVYVPQIGFRAELNSRWVSFGVEPKFGLGVNTYNDNVTVRQLRSPGDPTVSSDEREEILSAAGELNIYGRFHPRENITLSVGYTLMFIDNISRPHSSIYYDDPGIQNSQTQDSLIRVNPSFELMYFEGINVGAEIRF